MQKTESARLPSPRTHFPTISSIGAAREKDETPRPCEVYSPLLAGGESTRTEVGLRYRGLDYTITVSLETLIGPVHAMGYS